MRVYISGPMTGIEDHNYAVFDAMRDELLSRGYAVVNPADVARKLIRSSVITPERSDFLCADIHALLDCDGIFLLPGWQASEGALLEYQIAKSLGLDVLHE